MSQPAATKRKAKALVRGKLAKLRRIAVPPPAPVRRGVVAARVLTPPPVRQAHLRWKMAEASELRVRQEVQDIHAYLSDLIMVCITDGAQLQIELGCLSTLTPKHQRIRAYTLSEVSQFRMIRQPVELLSGLCFIGRFASEKDWDRVRDECVVKALRKHKDRDQVPGKKRTWEEAWLEAGDRENGYQTQLRTVRIDKRPARLFRRESSHVRYIYNPYGDTRRGGFPRDYDFKVQLVQTSDSLLPREAAGARLMLTWHVSAESYPIDDCQVDLIEVRQAGAVGLSHTVCVRLSHNHQQRLLSVYEEDKQYTAWAEQNELCVSQREPLLFPRAAKLTAQRLFATMCALAAVAKPEVYESESSSDEEEE